MYYSGSEIGYGIEGNSLEIYPLTIFYIFWDWGVCEEGRGCYLNFFPFFIIYYIGIEVVIINSFWTYLHNLLIGFNFIFVMSFILNLKSFKGI